MLSPKVSEPINKVFDSVGKIYPNIKTFSPSFYDYYRSQDMPLARTLVKKADIPWREILVKMGKRPNLDRITLSLISNILHLLAKKILLELKLGWDEVNVVAPDRTKSKILRPDAICLEGLYLHKDTIAILDVKLSIMSGLNAIYKYVPLFEQGIKDESYTTQQNFFEKWLPEDAVNVALMQHEFDDGQLGLYFENHILYISYLIGTPIKNLFPNNKISETFSKNNYRMKNKKKLPKNMEVRFISFFELPKLYCEIGGLNYLEYEANIKSSLTIAQFLKDLVLEAPDHTEEVSKKISRMIKENIPFDSIVSEISFSEKK